MKAFFNLLLVTVIASPVLARTKTDCREEFKALQTPVLASHLYDTGDFDAIMSGDWSNVFRASCQIKETMLIRTISTGSNYGDVKVECVKYEGLDADQKEELDALYKAARKEPLKNVAHAKDLKFLTTILYPHSKDELLLSGLTNSLALDSVERAGPASERLRELVVGLCAFAK